MITGINTIFSPFSTHLQMESLQNIFSTLHSFSPMHLLVSLLCLLSPICLIWGIIFAFYKRTKKERRGFAAITMLVAFIYILFVVNDDIEGLVLMMFLLTPWLLFLLYIFSICRENKKDMYTFGILFSGSILALPFLLMHFRWSDM